MLTAIPSGQPTHMSLPVIHGPEPITLDGKNGSRYWVVPPYDFTGNAADERGAAVSENGGWHVTLRFSAAQWARLQQICSLNPGRV